MYIDSYFSHNNFQTTFIYPENQAGKNLLTACTSFISDTRPPCIFFFFKAKQNTTIGIKRIVPSENIIISYLYNYLGALLLQLRVNTDDGDRVAGSDVEHPAHTLTFIILTEKQPDICNTWLPAPRVHLCREVFV